MLALASTRPVKGGNFGKWPSVSLDPELIVSYQGLIDNEIKGRVKRTRQQPGLARCAWYKRDNPARQNTSLHQWHLLAAESA